MSGGHFDYLQHRIDQCATEIEDIIYQHEEKVTEVEDDLYSDKTLNHFKTARRLLQMAAVYLHRIDYLVSGDDGEDSFHERLKIELARLDK